MSGEFSGSQRSDLRMDDRADGMKKVTSESEGHYLVNVLNFRIFSRLVRIFFVKIVWVY